MAETSDRQFSRVVKQVLTGIVLFGILIALFSWTIHQNRYKAGDSAIHHAPVAQRLQAVGGVYLSEAERTAAAEAAEAAAAAAEATAQASTQEEPAAAAAGAFDGSLDGQLIYDKVCAACHNLGVAGAPTMSARDWAPRLEKGYDTLLTHAIDGFNAMPPRGARMDLTDEQAAASLDYILDKLE